MEENLIYRKKAKSFITVAVTVSGILFAVQNMLLSYLNTSAIAESTDALSQIILHLPNIIITVLTLILFFLTGKKLTDDKRKTLIFMGSIYFGREAVACVTSFFSPVLEALSSFTKLSDTALSIISASVSIIEIPFVILIAYNIFTAFEGINSKFSDKRLDLSQMPLGRARSRYAGYSLIGGFVISMITAIPIFLIGLFINESFIGDNSGVVTTISSLFVASSAIVMQFIMIYYAGYKPYKNHIDGMAFIACSGLAGAISSIFLSFCSILQNTVLDNLPADISEGTAGAIFTLLSATTLVSTLSMFISLFLSMYLFKYFFSETKITLFGQNESVEFYESE